MSICTDSWEEPYVSIDDGVFIVPVDEADRVLFVVQPSIVDGHPVLGLPGGAVDLGELPIQTANRELQEEIGYSSGRIDLLYELNPLARHCDGRIFV